jgi:hypothetical protein
MRLYAAGFPAPVLILSIHYFVLIGHTVMTWDPDQEWGKCALLFLYSSGAMICHDGCWDGLQLKRTILPCLGSFLGRLQNRSV